MGIKQLYNDNLRKLPNEYGDGSVMIKINMHIRLCLFILHHYLGLEPTMIRSLLIIIVTLISVCNQRSI